jgi:hypothetical protein
MRGGRVSSESRHPSSTQKLRRSGPAGDRRAEGQGRRRRRREAVRAGLEGDWNPPTRSIRCPRTGGRPHPAPGAAGPRGRDAESSGEGSCSGLEPGRVEDPRFEGELWRGGSPGEQRPSVRGNSYRRERIRRGIKAPRWMKPGARAALPFEARSDREAGAPREKGAHSRRGKPGDCARAWESAETGGERSRAVRSARRWMTAGEQMAPRGVHDLCEGKALKGGTQERLRHETRPWNSS